MPIAVFTAIVQSFTCFFCVFIALQAPNPTYLLFVQTASCSAQCSGAVGYSYQITRFGPALQFRKIPQIVLAIFPITINENSFPPSVCHCILHNISCWWNMKGIEPKKKKYQPNFTLTKADQIQTLVLQKWSNAT